MVQCIGQSFRMHNWPLGSIEMETIQFFGYLDFSMAWSSQQFLMIMIILCSTLVLFNPIALSIASLIKNPEFPPIRVFTHIASRTSLIISHFFYIPFLNTLLGSIFCVIKSNQQPSNSIPPLNNHSSIIAGVGIAIFSFSGLIFFLVQPYYHAVGNGIVVGSFGAVTVTYLFGLISSISQNRYEGLQGMPIYAVILIWLFWGILFISIPTLVFCATVKYAKFLWAMRNGEIVPIAPEGDWSYFRFRQFIMDNNSIISPCFHTKSHKNDRSHQQSKVYSVYYSRSLDTLYTRY
ncbi:MAG: hypothetical protein EZS28_029361 [Streblomastix strix]|uniref:Uncharacterized protein n=1 Tax=Streblomastix strix TaxID=222440 RepID=A0A5J4UYD0_9EUKA|nr:MAG: hypothetical protein EZS28_029361 [Streblomastix strix]